MQLIKQQAINIASPRIDEENYNGPRECELSQLDDGSRVQTPYSLKECKHDECSHVRIEMRSVQKDIP